MSDKEKYFLLGYLFCVVIELISTLLDKQADVITFPATSTNNHVGSGQGMERVEGHLSHE